MENPLVKQPDYLFEISWEVCNKVGGIYTVLSTKAALLERKYQEKYILIGPDVWKGTGTNPDFIEDRMLFKLWRQRMEQEGLKTKIGRWKINGNPIAVLVDFTPYFFQRNEVFKHFWIKYKLDSLYGQWDYIEPALFGFAAGKVIECFYRSHVNSTDNVVAHFHEWMTGTGLLHLNEHVPQIGTVFTTHATVTGRAIAGKGLAVYQNLDNYIPEQQAREADVLSKHSLEKITAQNADCFTTVSWVTANECAKMLGKYPDIITPNGFDNSIVPPFSELEKKRELARATVLKVAEGLFNRSFDSDSLLVIKSGRYEYRNKGIDVFLDSLKELQKRNTTGKTVIALIFVPGNQTGPRKDLADRIQKPDFGNPLPSELLTHYLQGAQKDPIVRHITELGLNQDKNEQVKVIFVPTYLDGNDGIFNMGYYELLTGFDLAIFPSYYEPWGYTPLESLAYYIPSVTTDNSGFGKAFLALNEQNSNGLFVLERKEAVNHLIAIRIADTIELFLSQTDSEIQSARLAAHRISQNFIWENQLKFYVEAYGNALEKSFLREESYKDKPQALPVETFENIVSLPIWREITIKSELPPSLTALKELATNLWWSWNESAQSLFSSMDAILWLKSHQNPVKFLQSLHYTTIRKLASDKLFKESLHEVSRQFDNYVQSNLPNEGQVAYFCMEYGIHNSLKLYSGGLGILAGDYLKEASDNLVPIVAVGLLYKNGYFKQRLTVHGDQLVEADTMNFSELPVELVLDGENQALRIVLPFPGRTVYAQIWKVNVGRVKLYLLDTFVDQNKEEDKWITAQLYGGSQENRLKQELILGMGGVQALKLLGIKPKVFHCNEGHAAFVGISRIQDLILGDNLSFDEALEVVRSTGLFTTHTSVTAAIDKYSEELLRPYFSHVAKQFNISWEKFMNLGRISESNPDELFSMTTLALRMSQGINAVSKIHQKVSSNLFKEAWKDYFAEEIPIGYVTNGVHYDTWAASGWKTIHRKYFGENYLKDSSGWQKIEEVPDMEIWNTNLQLKQELLIAVKQRLADTMALRHESPGKIRHTLEFLREDALVIGYARRFVSYKRPELLLVDINRLSAMLSDKQKPVLVFFAGKSHPYDNESIKIIKKVVQMTLCKELQQKIFFLEDYDINLAKLLVQGVDVWINTPVRKMEASGTSGMKAMLNGTLNFSVLDGWWAEAYSDRIGWGLEAEQEYDSPDYQNDLDSDKIYKMLENEIIPMFFDRNDQDLPEAWIRMVKRSIGAAPQYLMGRVMKEYRHNYYDKLMDRGARLSAEGFAMAKALVVWKKHVRRNWNDVDVLSITPELLTELGKGEELTLVLTLGDFKAEEIGVELIALKLDSMGDEEKIRLIELSAKGLGGGRQVFGGQIGELSPGNYQYGFRIFPKNVQIENRCDFPLVKWI
ncbi:alpha-glucan family phosphorylase [Algoriphagus sp. Y33]|uniref:alpha-glucan family phosphorylase n=1 Tax=Algoriphagus sp. Y33 TaxID=2772483 RepID=UPI001781DF8B|nr:alpha-glucan family phosphorylase [Algoriphagus sp. Y33]